MRMKCKSCGERLIDGPAQTRSASSSRFSVTLNGLPSKICAKGCSGSYWYHPDLREEVLDMLLAGSREVARRKLGLFQTRQQCPQCGIDLEDEGRIETFTFEKKAFDKGSRMELVVRGPAQVCKRCGRPFLPAPTGSRDDYYRELAEVIALAVSKDFLYE